MCIYYYINVEFNNLNHFVDCVNKLNVPGDLANIRGTIDAFNSIGRGCNCSRQQRVDGAINSYKNLLNILSELEKLFLKASYNNQIIIFKDGANILGQF